MEEKELIYEAQKGNRSALNSLIINNYQVLKGYVYKMTGSMDESQDIIQDTLLKAVLNIKKFKPEAKFSTWLIKISINSYRDSLRKTKREVPINEEIINENFNLEDTAFNNIEYLKALKILKQMPLEKRAVFILKNYYDYKYEEIAKIMDCPVGTVRSRLHNCVKEIIKRMEEI